MVGPGYSELASATVAGLNTRDRLVRWALGYEDLIRSSALELYDLTQRPVFLKNLVFQTMDFVVREIESGGALAVRSP